MSPRARLAIAVSSGVLLLLTVFVAVPYWLLTRDGMIEISVHESPPDGAQVDLRVPASLVRVAGALVPRVRTVTDDAELAGALLAIRAGLDALEAAPDAVFVAVDEPGSRVRVAKKDGFLLVEVDDDGDRVRVSVPPVAVRVLTDLVPRLARPVPDPA